MVPQLNERVATENPKNSSSDAGFRRSSAVEFKFRSKVPQSSVNFSFDFGPFSGMKNSINAVVTRVLTFLHTLTRSLSFFVLERIKEDDQPEIRLTPVDRPLCILDTLTHSLFLYFLGFS